VRPAIWFPSLVCASLVLAGCSASTSTTRPSTTTPTHPSSPPPSTPEAGTPLHFSAATPVAPGTGLASVSCGSPTFCVAFDAAGRAHVFNGTRWSGPDPVAPQAIGPGAISVSCSNPIYCMAVATAGDQVTSWDGQTWSAPVTLDGANGLEAVGCAPAGYCAAVDAEGNAFAFTGGSWSGTSGDWGSVSAISCVNPSFCMSTSGGISQWNGAQWSTPDPYGATSSFTGVSCPTASFCTAVEQAGSALQWNGAIWSAPVRIEPGPAPTTSIGVAPTAVSCPTASYCAATDAAGGILQWNAGVWTRADVDGGRTLTSISCPTPTLCVAVDRSGNAVVGRP